MFYLPLRSNFKIKIQLNYAIFLLVNQVKLRQTVTALKTVNSKKVLPLGKSALFV